MENAKKPLVPALEKGMKILELLSRTEDFLTMSQMAKSLNYKVTEIQRMVEYLHENGYIFKNSQKGFYISSKFCALTSRVDINQILINKISPYMNRFSSESLESAQLSILSDRELRLLYHTEGGRHVRLAMRPGMFDPLKTISGRLLVGCLGEAEQVKFNLNKEDIKMLAGYKADYERHGYWAGESPCFSGVYKLSTLFPIPDTGISAAFTCTYLLPRDAKPEEYRQRLLYHFLRTRDDILEVI